jgi:peptidase E
MGFVAGRQTLLAPGPVFGLCRELAGFPARTRLCFLGTAGGDQRHRQAAVLEAFQATTYTVSVLSLLPMPSVPDVRAHLLAQDIIWVDGGSVAGLLALWRLHELGPVMAEAWEAGVVLAGVSAGSICWHVGGPTDSFGPTLRPVTNALALLPYGNGVHYDSEAQRRPLLHHLVGAGTLPTSYATDDGAGLVYRGTDLVEAVADREGAAAYRIERKGPKGVREVVLPTRRLG